MKKALFFIAFCFLSMSLFAQQDDIEKLHQNAKTFMRQGDYANASIILVRALQQEPGNIAIAKDLAYNYYLLRQNDKALAVLKPFLDKDNVDDQTYQIAGTVYNALGQPKESEKLYKKAIKTFPGSGPLYNEYGELLWSRQDPNAIKLWEQGIEMDPSYANNYYNACKYYASIKEKIWCLIYGENFINIESFTARTAEVKHILLDGYKRLFGDVNLLSDAKDKNKFEVAFLTTMNKQNSVVINGLNAETLTMIRTRFILDWNKDYASQFPMKLFDLQKDLLERGMFPMYNQWVFGAAQNLSAYQNWTATHSAEYIAFNDFQKNSIFKIPKGQYYR